MKLIDKIIKECKQEIEEYNKNKTEEPYDDSTELYEGSILEGRKEFADYIYFIIKNGKGETE